MLTKDGFINKEIIITGLKESYRILQISDSHIVSMDQREEGFFIEDGPHKGKKLTDFGKMRQNRFSYENDSTNLRFSALCDYLNKNPHCADAIVFTGDILDFFTESAYSFMLENLKKINIPFMFTLGNHDMIMSRMSDTEVREKFSELCGGDTYLQKMKLGELALIGIDNTDNKYEPHTLKALDEALEKEENPILFQHVPLCTKDLHLYTLSQGHKDYSIGEDGVHPDCSWKEFFEKITSPKSKVKALICGDCHFEHQGKCGNFTQFVAPLSAESPDVLFTIHG